MDEMPFCHDSDEIKFFFQYHLSRYQQNMGAPIITKQARIMAAVVQNQAEILQELLDSPELYTITDGYHLTILQIAIIEHNKEVFDYMLSIPDFPINFVDKLGRTALTTAFDGFLPGELISKHYAYELIIKGACVNVICSNGTPLHCALRRSFDEVALLLIEKGVNVNVCDRTGYTLLELAVRMSKGVAEVVSALVKKGAKSTMEVFEFSVVKNLPYLLQEMLFPNENQEIEVSLRILLILVESQSSLLDEFLKCPMVLKIDTTTCCVVQALCTINLDCFKTVIEKFGKPLKRALALCENKCVLLDVPSTEFITHFTENLNFMFETELRSGVCSCISKLHSGNILRALLKIREESVITNFFCYFLTLGLNITEWDLQLVYEKYGYCELFKILLHMDIEMDVTKREEMPIMPILIYDVTANLDDLLKGVRSYTYMGYGHNEEYSLRQLCEYFVNHKLHKMHPIDKKMYGTTYEFPEVPLLLEMARNALRKYLIETFQIRTSRKFYTILNSLPISEDCKKIVSYETKLYHILQI